VVSKGAATKTAILDEATRLASTIGFNALTVGTLAERTELSKSGLFAHFKSKEQLQLQTLSHAGDLFVDAVIRPSLAAPRGEARVRELFTRWLDWASSALPGGCIYIAANIEFDDQPGAMRDQLVAQQLDWRDTIATVVTTAITEGDFRDDVDPGQFAFELSALFLGFHHAWRLLGDPQARARTEAAFESLVARSH